MLPLPYVEKIHRLLAVRYGARWVSLWAGIEQRDIQADWSSVLDGMTAEGIKQALANLPAEFPPTASAFRALGAIRHEAEVFKALPPPPSSPDAARRISEAVRTMAGKPTPAERMAGLWARLDAGEPMSAAMRDFLGRAERSYSHVVALPGDFTPIPASVLPPGMRADRRDEVAA